MRKHLSLQLEIAVTEKLLFAGVGNKIDAEDEHSNSQRDSS